MDWCHLIFSDRLDNIRLCFMDFFTFLLLNKLFNGFFFTFSALLIICWTQNLHLLAFFCPSSPFPPYFISLSTLLLHWCFWATCFVVLYIFPMPLVRGVSQSTVQIVIKAWNFAHSLRIAYYFQKVTAILLKSSGGPDFKITISGGNSDLIIAYLKTFGNNNCAFSPKDDPVLHI